MDSASLFHELSLDQMVEIGAQCQAGDILLEDHERFELARLIVQRKRLVNVLEDMVMIYYPPKYYPPAPS